MTMNAVATKKPFDQQHAEARIRVLGREVGKIEEQMQGLRDSPEDIIERINLKDRLDKIQEERIQFGRELLEHDRQKAIKKEKQAEADRKDAHIRLDVLLKDIDTFFSELEKDFAKKGEQFIKMRASAEELRKLDTRVEYHTRRAAISYGHLVSPHAIDALLQTLVSDAFDIRAIRGHQRGKGLQEVLKKIANTVEPREKANNA